MLKEGLIKDYLDLLNKNDNHELTLLYEKIILFSNKHFIPAVSYDVAFFLYWITSLVKPKNILEIGFGAGASSVFIKKALSGDSQITSLERDHNRVARGKNLFNELKIDGINLVHTDAFIFLENTSVDKYDMVFLDAVKKDYKDYRQKINNVISSGGIMICDNIFFNKRVVEKNVDKKYLNGVNSIKQFNEELSRDDDFITYFVNIGDGLSLSVKK